MRGLLCGRLNCLALGVALVLLAVACAPVEQAGRGRYFWPPPPQDQPRIEYINFYQSTADVKRGADNWLESAVLGEAFPQLLFSRPTDIVSDRGQRLFVTDIARGEVYVVDLVQHQLRALQHRDGGNYQFRLPSGVALTPSGAVYVAESVGSRILFFGPDEREVASFGDDDIERPGGMAYDASRDRLYVCDVAVHQLKVFSGSGALQETLGGRGMAPGEFNFPLDVALDLDGNIYVLDAMNARVQVFDPELKFLRQFGERGTALGSFQVPKAIGVGPSGQVYVSDSRANRIVVFDLEGRYLLTFGGSYAVVTDQVAPGGFYLAAGVDVDVNDTIWVVDAFNRMVHQFQYLNESYLAQHPIRPEEVVIPVMPETPPEDGGGARP